MACQRMSPSEDVKENGTTSAGETVRSQVESALADEDERTFESNPLYQMKYFDCEEADNNVLCGLPFVAARHVRGAIQLAHH